MNGRPIKHKQPQPRWRADHVGMIRFSTYWHKYCLILDVNEETQTVTELDKFAEVNYHPCYGAGFRIHRTPPDRNDKFLTVAEFYRQVIDITTSNTP